jgi:BirA family biotin operon repressor/biotin-[acetyl-CoA-carboxylase] ligase
MNHRLIIGNKILKLTEVDSTNRYLKELIIISPQAEGLVVIADSQTNGVGQRGNAWDSEKNKNLTFSLLLKPKIDARNQFEITQIISLAIIEFLNSIGILATIKWPNDIFIDNDKVGGMLIENTIRDGKIMDSIIGVGLNINQTEFSTVLINASSLKLKMNLDYNLESILEGLLNFIDKQYLAYKTKSNKILQTNYLDKLFRFNELVFFEINGKSIKAIISGVDESGKLILNINNTIQSFDLKEVKFLF